MKEEKIKLQKFKDHDISKVAGGMLNDSQVKEFFPNSSKLGDEYLKRSYAEATCEKCGKKFARHCGTAIGMATNTPDFERYRIRQRFCKECADEKIENDIFLRQKRSLHEMLKKLDR